MFSKSKLERQRRRAGTGEPAPRRGMRRAALEVIYDLRMAGDSPGKKAGAVGIGVLIGCSPFYGLHLALCLFFARIFRLNQILTYLAAHVSVPGLWPFLVLAELQLGRLLRGKPMLALHVAELRHLDPWTFAGDLLLGSAAVGVPLALILAWLTYRVAAKARQSSETVRLIEETSRCYIDSGVFAWEFARAKLRHDPMYFALLQGGRLPAAGRLLDLGCGRGLLFALIAAARRQAERGVYPPDWPPPPAASMHGIEGRARRAKEARTALGEEAEIEVANLRHAERLALPEAQGILLLDVLHYLPAEGQERLLDRAVAALAPGGRLFVREADAAAGAAFARTRAAERLAAWGRGHFRQHFHFRSASEWEKLLRARGLAVSSEPMAHGTPYANVLIEGVS